MLIAINEITSTPVQFLHESGIYFLFDKNYQLLYIGSSGLLRSRILKHAIDDKMKWYGIYYALIIPILDNGLFNKRRFQLEKDCIHYFQPLLNKYK